MIVERLTDGTLSASLADVKHHLRVDHSDDDMEITRFLGAAQRELEHHASLAVTRQTIRCRFTGWPCGGWVRLPIGPVESGAPAPTVTADGTAISPELVAGLRPRLYLADPRDYLEAEIVAEYEAGFDTAPDDLVAAILDQAAQYYDARAVAAVNGTAQPGISAHAARIVAHYRGVAI